MNHKGDLIPVECIKTNGTGLSDDIIIHFNIISIFNGVFG